MSFLQLHIKNRNKDKSTKYSLRANLCYPQKNVLLKRASSFTLLMPRASMTVEAAFAVPLFLFFFLHIMSAISMIEMQSRLEAALHQTGNKMAFAGYAYEKTAGSILPEGLASIALTQGYAKNQIVSYAGEKYLEHSAIKNGAAGIHFTGTSIMQENDKIDICLSYTVKPLTGILGFEEFSIKQRYYGRAFTGYDTEEGISDMTQTDPMVYVTKTGTVYHTNRNCTYLNPSIEAVAEDTVADRRNSSGAKYYLCEACGDKVNTGTVYITEYGSSYHSMLNCSKLKRTIYTIPLSQTGGRGRCAKCG